MNPDHWPGWRTDGWPVHLSVRTVVIYGQPFPDQSRSRLSGARLVNAIGRA
jgi:hypothetical protein